MTARLARPGFGINHVIAYGQSLSSGWEGWPALSVVPRHDSLMLGRSVRPVDENQPDWVPVGDVEFHPLVATVQDRDSGALLGPAVVAGLPRRAVALGETVLEAAVNDWRGRMLAANPAMAAHLLLASSCGVGGRSLAALSKGARPALYDRLRACSSLARAVAARHGRSYGIAALLFLQGEAESLANAESVDDADGAAYRDALRRWRDDVIADLAGGIAGQADPPALFLNQTGGPYANDAHTIGMAQLEVALSDPRCFMVGPSYPVPDKAGHLDPNGYRWLGAQFGKVMHLVLDQGVAWRPLHPLAAVVQAGGAEVRVRFHVPVPPLAWGTPFRHQRPFTPRDRGFTVVDGGGVVPIGDVGLEGPDTVVITLARPAQDGLRVRYADRSRHAGRGCLHDSDASLAEDCFVFDPVAGHDPAADMAAWTGRRYPLMNWCVGFNLAVAVG